MVKNKKRLAILKNELPDDHILWERACDEFSDHLEYEVVDIFSNQWFESIVKGEYDCLLAKPSGLSSLFKQLYDERIMILRSALNIPIYPLPIEIYFYENKRFFYSWLKANNLPHPETHLFFYRDEAEQYIRNILFPVVAKANLGASGSGVRILRNKNEAYDYLHASFSGKGVPRRWGPNLSYGGWFKRGIHYIINPADIYKKIRIYTAKRTDVQKAFVIFQEYIEHNYEWRVVAIGGSYFAHKKLKIGEKASGSLLKNYSNPPHGLFYFAKSIIDRFGLYSQAIDLFEIRDGHYLINEMQCIFGQSDPYQMIVDEKPGRYRFNTGKWIFEEGEFNQNESYNLRVDHILRLLEK